ncbi:MAG: CRISPR-associated endonuclease Cas3'', partial [Porticoccaceae bacterium]|nr:CRISPR-associated endonuclease Cas3'' [Porticoccaceae bacterium]
MSEGDLSESRVSATFFNYWGKAQPADNDDKGYHLLPWHGLDVAAVGWQLLDPQQPRCQQLAKILEVEPGWLQRWFTFCLALHDLGKFASGFQGLVPELSDELISPDSRYTYSERHDSLGWWLWRERLFKPLLSGVWKTRHHWRQAGAAAEALGPWLQVVFGHHGQPPIARGDISCAF